LLSLHAARLSVATLFLLCMVTQPGCAQHLCRRRAPPFGLSLGPLSWWVWFCCLTSFRWGINRVCNHLLPCQALGGGVSVCSPAKLRSSPFFVGEGTSSRIFLMCGGSPPYTPATLRLSPLAHNQKETFWGRGKTWVR